jgi:hypothetical protein
VKPLIATVMSGSTNAAASSALQTRARSAEEEMREAFMFRTRLWCHGLLATGMRGMHDDNFRKAKVPVCACIAEDDENDGSPRTSARD